MRRIQIYFSLRWFKWILGQPNTARGWADDRRLATRKRTVGGMLYLFLAPDIGPLSCHITYSVHLYGWDMRQLELLIRWSKPGIQPAGFLGKLTYFYHAVYSFYLTIYYLNHLYIYNICCSDKTSRWWYWTVYILYSNMLKGWQSSTHSLFVMLWARR